MLHSDSSRPAVSPVVHLEVPPLGPDDYRQRSAGTLTLAADVQTLRLMATPAGASGDLRVEWLLLRPTASAAAAASDPAKCDPG